MKLNLNLIWAQGRNRIIGSNGTMPWDIPEDLAHFKAVTQGYPVIMGRKTWDSLPPKFRPLPKRRNIVLTRQKNWGNEYDHHQVIKANTLESALSSQILGPNVDSVWVIGGGQIYLQYLPKATKLEITEIDADFMGDTQAPEISPNEWLEVNRIPNVSKSGIKFDFVTYRRKLAAESTSASLF